MANLDLTQGLVRKSILDDIRSNENVQRKRDSLKDFEIYQDRILPYVRQELCNQLGVSTANQMPIVSTLNIGKFIVKNEATIYTCDPEREISDADESDVESVDNLYKEKQFNSKLQKANIWYKYRGQSFIQVVPKDDCLDLRVLLPHHIDVIPDANDPEKPYAYIMSAFDKSPWLIANQDNVNEKTADTDDYKSSLERYVVWTAEYNFIMNGRGELVTEIIPNQIAMLPFVDVSKDKDFEFFVRLGGCLSDFTVQYNVSWTDAAYVNRMQGFSVGVLSGDANLKPDQMTIGPAKLLFLPTNPAQPNSKLDLEFMSPNPNIEASLKMIHQLLSDFLMTRGLDTKKVSSALSGGDASYSSAIERLLAQVEEFKATKEDFDLFRMVEKKVFTIVKRYLVVLSGAGMLEDSYRVAPSFDKATMDVEFESPEMVQTETEEIADQAAKIAIGIADRVTAIMDLEDMSEDEAVAYIAKIDSRRKAKLAGIANADQVTQNQPV